MLEQGFYVETKSGTKVSGVNVKINLKIKSMLNSLPTDRRVALGYRIELELRNVGIRYDAGSGNRTRNTLVPKASALSSYPKLSRLLLCLCKQGKNIFYFLYCLKNEQ